MGQHWLMQYLVTWRHQAITLIYVDSWFVRFCGIYLRAISQQVAKLLFRKMSKIIYLILLLPQGAGELTQWPLGSWSSISGCYLKLITFKLIPRIDIMSTCCEITLGDMAETLADEQATLVQVMAWCRQTTSHYVSQCWPRSMALYGVTKLQWVNLPQVIIISSSARMQQSDMLSSYFLGPLAN